MKNKKIKIIVCLIAVIGVILLCIPTRFITTIKQKIGLNYIEKVLTKKYGKLTTFEIAHEEYCEKCAANFDGCNAYRKDHTCKIYHINTALENKNNIKINFTNDNGVYTIADINDITKTTNFITTNFNDFPVKSLTNITGIPTEWEEFSHLWYSITIKENYSEDNLKKVLDIMNKFSAFYASNYLFYESLELDVIFQNDENIEHNTDIINILYSNNKIIYKVNYTKLIDGVTYTTEAKDYIEYN